MPPTRRCRMSSSSTSTRPRTCCSPRPWHRTRSMSTDAGRVEVIALDGLPEIREGDDLEGRIVDALEATPGILPVQPGDVLVVTQKIVSKAEGAVVDLRTIEPSPQAIEWARTWDRDARQIEVVLREAVRIVRM